MGEFIVRVPLNRRINSRIDTRCLWIIESFFIFMLSNDGAKVVTLYELFTKLMLKI